MKMQSGNTDAEKALFGVIFRYGNQCLSQASMKTGFGITELRAAKQRLVDNNVIREIPNQNDRDEDYRSFEINS